MPAAFAKCRCLSPYHVPVSSPRRIARSMRISRTTRSCTLLVKGYVTYPAGATVDEGREITDPIIAKEPESFVDPPSTPS